MIHVTSNMHNIPWQYQRSAKPHDIDSLVFRGQSVSLAQIEQWKIYNSTFFPTTGYGEIPGNQITYPRFEKNRSGQLYVTYRFAAKPKRSFPERTYSGGIAAYDPASMHWWAIGGPVVLNAADADEHPLSSSVVTAFSGRTGWTVYHPQLLFDGADQMHVFSFWRSGTAGPTLTRPCFVKQQNDGSFATIDGELVSTPLQPRDCGNLGFSNNTEFYTLADSGMDSQGNPFIVVSPVGEDRILLTYNAQTDSWNEESPPSGAHELFLSHDDTLWAVATGPRIFRRNSPNGSWQLVGSTANDGNCLPKADVSEDGRTAFIHMIACDFSTVSVYAVNLD